jgi:branched-chain amino acid transport system ATP-binding protein
LLKVEKLNAFYGPVQILHDINIAVEAGQVVGLVGANAAGKTTLLFSLVGLRTRCTGSILLAGERIDTLAAYERVGRGLVLVPERRRLFPFMTVLENLEIGAYSAAARATRNDTLRQVYDLLPVLAERSAQRAGSLSGGEQQMLAIGRALMSKPRVLLLDEPTEGLAPRYISLLYQLVGDLRRQGHTILIVEQSVQHILRITDRAYVLEHGHIVLEGPGQKLLNDERLKVAYLGM